MTNNVRVGDSVLIIWNNGDQIIDQSSLQNLVNDIKIISKNDSVVLENSSMITESSRSPSSFDIVISNFISPHTVQHTDKLLAVILKLLKPSGKLVLKDEADLNATLKLSGFINVTKESDSHVAEKPKFEVGSKASLKLNGKVNKPAIWKLDDTVEAVWTGVNDDDIIDDDQLLDEDDLKKPDQSSLRVCSTTGQRKACADCSCGLAEELAGTVKDTPKSSCGSNVHVNHIHPAKCESDSYIECYLGDAFRCASCPYLGMPAFKPGEKVLLDLNSDI